MKLSAVSLIHSEFILLSLKNLYLINNLQLGPDKQTFSSNWYGTLNFFNTDCIIVVSIFK